MRRRNKINLKKKNKFNFFLIKNNKIATVGVGKAFKNTHTLPALHGLINRPLKVFSLGNESLSLCAAPGGCGPLSAAILFFSFFPFF